MFTTHFNGYNILTFRVLWDEEILLEKQNKF